MEEKCEGQLLLGQYSTYNEAKERFVDRNFETNRFYMALSLIFLLITYILTMLVPSIGVILTASIIGMILNALWWLNIDSFQFLIKVKYSKVLEAIEEKLPISPFKDEFEEVLEAKKNKKAIIFSDMQKFFTLFIFCIFVTIFVRYAYLLANVVSKGG